MAKQISYAEALLDIAARYPAATEDRRTEVTYAILREYDMLPDPIVPDDPNAARIAELEAQLVQLAALARGAIIPAPAPTVAPQPFGAVPVAVPSPAGPAAPVLYADPTTNAVVEAAAARESVPVVAETDAVAALRAQLAGGGDALL